MKVAALSFAALGLSFTLGSAAQAASLVSHDNWADGSGVVTDTSTRAPVSTCGNATSGAGVALTDGGMTDVRMSRVLRSPRAVPARRTDLARPSGAPAGLGRPCRAGRLFAGAPERAL